MSGKQTKKKKPLPAWFGETPGPESKEQMKQALAAYIVEENLQS